ncbi:hypothetical protein [Ornithinimicrobium sp. INDO-MA30-4]|uniref:hypothetical protein n=1 Tax=Ornithinimicrobium sp. INDO-MA30-4 TaxID=2908651 RepID=UPI001F1670E6|nr:hypothetical protein [Ornithinimicrobium sp. INDO-MA30-4]UJH70166.1 hypothetical protein L0A91_13375 [Ornithinimicrobium sp. INDO-MA30-4]
MTDLSAFGLIDLAALLIVAGAIIGSLRRGGQMAGAIAATLSAGLFVWLGVAAMEAWGSVQISAAAANSHVAHLLPMPSAA